MAVWRLQVNTGGANVADYCLQNHVAALWAGKVLAMERLQFIYSYCMIIVMTTTVSRKYTLYKSLFIICHIFS